MDTQLIIDVARLDRDGEDCAGTLDDAVLELDGELLRPFGGIRYSLFVQPFGTELLCGERLRRTSMRSVPGAGATSTSR